MAELTHRYVLPADDPVAVEVATTALWAAGTAGLWERERGDGRAEIVAYFDRRSDAVPPGGRWEIEDPHDWLAEWRRGLDPIRVGPLLVAPSWHEAAEDPQAIRIDPEMAFGTGHHATTHLCLTALVELVEPGDRVLDIGTGTGVLAVAAARLGAGSVLAVDIDPDAVEVARRNVAANLDDPSRVRVRLGSVPGDDPVDLVVANLVTATIVDLARELADLVRPGGHLVASGIATERAERVVGLLEDLGLEVTRREHADGWVAITARRDPDALPSPGSPR